MYYKSRTDFNIVQVPNPAPVMGPAGSIVIDPDFQNEIVRLTDEHSMFNGQFALAGIGGSADVNTWNSDSTMLSLQDSGGGGGVFGFDPSSMAVKKLFPNWRIGTLVFSRLDPNIAFSFNGKQFLRFDLSNRTLVTPPTPVVVCDFSPFIPASITWSAMGGVELSDAMFTAAFSVSGAQGTGIYACSFCVGKGYRALNTQTGVIVGDYGALGSILIPDRFTIHNVKQSKDGVNLVIATTKTLAGTGKGPFLWQIDTANVQPLGGEGHWTAGYGEFLDNGSSPVIPYWSHRHTLFTQSVGTRVSNPTPKLVPPLDDHLSFNGPQNGMFISLSADTGHWATFPGPWYDEVLGFDLSGNGKVYRFCHTFSSGKSGNFYADSAIGAVDQLNKFVVWTSDWMRNIKNPDGSYRIDAFAVKLR